MFVVSLLVLALKWTLKDIKLQLKAWIVIEKEGKKKNELPLNDKRVWKRIEVENQQQRSVWSKIMKEVVEQDFRRIIAARTESKMKHMNAL